MKIGIYGASDDGVVLEIDGKTVEEYDTYEPGPVMWRAELHAPDGATMRVQALFTDSWSIAVGPAGEEALLPAWPVVIVPATDECRSAMAEIQAPDGTEIISIWPLNDGDDD